MSGRGVPLFRDGAFDGAVLTVGDVSALRRRGRDLERQRDELATQDRIDELLFEITRDLFESPSRDAIEETVCDRLAASTLYRFAWIGEPVPAADRLVPRTSAGIDDGAVESMADGTAAPETGEGPYRRALRSGAVQASRDVRSDPAFEQWRETALELDVRSAAAIPLVRGETTYGVLAVHATRPLGFSLPEQARLESLGETVGFAIDAVETRALLFADAVVELEFDVTDSGQVLVRTSDRLGCELAVTGAVESATDRWSVYLAVDRVAPAAVRDFASDDPAVERVRVVADEGDAGLLELVASGPALYGATGLGAALTAGSVDAGRGRFRFEVPQSSDVRRVVHRFRTSYPESTLVARREFDRPVQRARELRQSLDDRLTDRQREALVRAHHAGYFDWPRRCTAGDVATSMDIGETTFHYHLRNALETLSSLFTGREKRS